MLTRKVLLKKRANVLLFSLCTFVHYLGEVPVLLPGAVVERDEVHASLSAEVPSIEPVPILKCHSCSGLCTVNK